eukprot:TRINITY_DN15118_c0_g1_i1.p1 TRINITY_DN15118_c0_g1~~TRINITY_DN15118_c0_g1_i1.p1  ORF type:complete len:291 (+),score=90.90 TRINITY_DN15118_c0_g1_i1:379-1251(+)
MADDSSEDVVGALAPVLRLSQSEISFQAPFGKAPEQRIFLSNPSDDAVAFKIRTTAPKRYCVRPNIGIVPAKEKVEIQVVLSPSKDPVTDYNQRDKFQILSVVVKDALKLEAANADPNSVRDLFEKTANVPTMKQKLRCSFKAPPSGSANAPAAAPNATAASDAAKKKTTKSVAFEGTGSAATATEPAAPTVEPAAPKPSADTISDRYSSTLTESIPDDSGLRQRNVDSASPPKPTVSAASTATKPPVVVAKPSPSTNVSVSGSNSSMLPIAVVFFVGIFVGLMLSRMFS